MLDVLPHFPYVAELIYSAKSGYHPFSDEIQTLVMNPKT
jgi:hypothetical protein